VPPRVRHGEGGRDFAAIQAGDFHTRDQLRINSRFCVRIVIVDQRSEWGGIIHGVDWHIFVETERSCASYAMDILIQNMVLSQNSRFISKVVTKLTFIYLREHKISNVPNIN
jgi:hypothetical protein